MRVMRVDEARGLALCEDDDGRRSTVEVALGGRGRPGDDAARARGDGDRAQTWRQSA